MSKCNHTENEKYWALSDGMCPLCMAGVRKMGEETELKPCPICASKNLRRGYGDDCYMVCCDNCGTVGPTDLTREHAAQMWNLRRPEDALRAELAAATDKLDTAALTLARMQEQLAAANERAERAEANIIEASAAYCKPGTTEDYEAASLGLVYMSHAGAAAMYEVSDLRSQVAQLREATRWIPVEDRYPGEDERVLVTSRGQVVIGLWSWQVHWEGERERLWFDDEYACIYDVTHWMPLPNPPEAK